MSAHLLYTRETENGLIKAISPANRVPALLSHPPVTAIATIVRGLKVPAATNAPEPLAATSTLVARVTLIAMRAARTPNTSSVWIDTTTADNAQLIELFPGAEFTLIAPRGKAINLATIYLDVATLGDGLFFHSP
jgi:hypothetical protein